MISNLSPRTLLAGLAVAALTLAACGSDGSDSNGSGSDDGTTAPDGDTGAAPSAEDLDGRSFESTETSGYDLVEGSTITLRFADGSLGANAGCNSMSGAFTIEDGALSVGEMAATMMACDEALMAQDTWLGEFFAASPQVALDGDTLTLTGDEATLTFAEIADVAIEGTTWIVTGTIDGDAVASVPEGAASLTITDGALALNSGCNTGRGDVEVGDSTLTFGPVALTRMACIDDALSALEAAVTTVLDGEVSYQIDGASLVITAPSGAGLQLTAG